MQTDYECSICLDTALGTAKQRLSCGHEFHRVCITGWLSYNKSCPVCRKRNSATSSRTPEDEVESGWTFISVTPFSFTLQAQSGHGAQWEQRESRYREQRRRQQEQRERQRGRERIQREQERMQREQERMQREQERMQREQQQQQERMQRERQRMQRKQQQQQERMQRERQRMQQERQRRQREPFQNQFQFGPGFLRFGADMRTFEPGMQMFGVEMRNLEENMRSIGDDMRDEFAQFSTMGFKWIF